jgi:hypothetical protein
LLVIVGRWYRLEVATQGEPVRRTAVEGIIALIKLWSGVQRAHEDDGDEDDHSASGEGTGDPDMLHVKVRLTALITDGASVTSGHDDFGISVPRYAPRHGLAVIWHRYRRRRPSRDPARETELLNRTNRVGLPDIEAAINQMLGRDPKQHRPPRLAWRGLIDALAGAGIVVTEQELIGAPLTLDLSPDGRAQIAGTSG